MTTTACYARSWPGVKHDTSIMLIQLQIHNFVIIEQLVLQFESGMTVLTGETGAGKSILIDAIGLVLGDKAETAMIRDNQDRAEIAALFNVETSTQILQILEEQAITVDDNELTIRRVISRDGRSRAFVNSSPVPVQLLKTLGELLIDIHGQHAHQSLMHRNSQRNLLDSYAGHKAELESVKSAWALWHAASRQLAQTSSDSGNHEATIALLQYQVGELEELHLEAGEYSRLEDDLKRLTNASRLQQTSAMVLASLEENEISVEASLHNAIREIKDLARFDTSLSTVLDLLDTASIQLAEAVTELKSCSSRFESDPEQLQQVSTRLDLLHDMARKHHVPVQQLAGHLQQLQNQLERLNNSSETVSKLLQQQAQAHHLYQQTAKKLTDSRVKAAKAMAQEVSVQLHGLGMSEARFIVEITASGDEAPQSGGYDHVEFLVSMNPGHAPQPLRKVASGGELSRVSLAIQIVSKDEQAIPTLIFDEVDAGIGGGTAEIVGKLLHDLARHSQVFCVTHLPQVASQAHQHFQVSKHIVGGITEVQVKPLRGDARIDEISRMLGGVKISDKTRAHAKEMLGQLAKA
jgi:DNA repair protein RecN (Recombination protein N)